MNWKKFRITFDNVIEIFLCTLIICLPFSKSMVEICFGGVFILWVIKRFLTCRDKSVIEIIKSFKPAAARLNVPILAFVLVNLVSTLTSLSVFLSLEGFFFKLFEGVAIYFVIVDFYDNSEKINRFLTALFFSIILISANGLYQYIFGTDFIRGYSFNGHGGIQSSFGNPNDFAAWLVMIIPFVIALAFFWKSEWVACFSKHIKPIMKNARFLFLPVGFVLLVCLVLVGSRGAWLASLLSLFFLGFILKSRKLIVVLLLVIFVIPFIIPDRVKERAVSILNSNEIGGSINIRLKLWREAMEIIEDFPLLGTGPNTYSIVAPEYKNESKTGFYPHNSYLHMAAETGLLGIGAFLWIVLALFKTTFHKIKKIGNDFERTLLAGFLAGMAGFLAHSIVDTNLYALQLNMLMWMVMGLIISVQNQTSVTD